MGTLVISGSGRTGVAIALLLILSALSLFNNLCYNYLRPANRTRG